MRGYKVRRTIKEKDDIIFLVCAWRYNAVNPTFIRISNCILGARLEKKILKKNLAMHRVEMLKMKLVK